MDRTNRGGRGLRATAPVTAMGPVAGYETRDDTPLLPQLRHQGQSRDQRLVRRVEEGHVLEHQPAGAEPVRRSPTYTRFPMNVIAVYPEFAAD
ncbi:hypothetical protein F8G81_20610 [Arthrobacter sp. CDRTa11]|uniref:hypothetical protein n=1 Tax=Arthrobacter sp. CDRTa11 TaxID=2651199 RepID=UPI002265F44C|nr:hypothetical protein [Arthrobacter sp. CDRTa11]UZX04733.1 hypothetical protein F8G81_20610 [Arthrobacter sp. CDRTa11]